MAGIFISYRRSDSAAMCDRIYAALVQHFGKDAIFKDIESIPLGINFVDYIRRVISQTAVVIVIIGRTWLEETDARGHRRIDDPNDFVRQEIDEAFARNIPVIPLRVDGAAMPKAEQLPEQIRSLVAQNGWEVHYDPYFTTDIERVTAGLERWVLSLQARGQFPEGTIPDGPIVEVTERSPSGPAQAPLPQRFSPTRDVSPEHEKRRDQRLQLVLSIVLVALGLIAEYLVTVFVSNPPVFVKSDAFPVAIFVVWLAFLIYRIYQARQRHERFRVPVDISIIAVVALVASFFIPPLTAHSGSISPASAKQAQHSTTPTHSAIVTRSATTSVSHPSSALTTPAPTSSCAPASWTQTSTANVSSANSHFSGVAAVSANDVWAVGQYSVSSNTDNALIGHWNGSSWNVVASPNVGSGTNVLIGASAVSATDVWAVGQYYDPPGSSGAMHALIEQWTGSSWSVVNSPSIGSQTNLTAIAALSATDVWTTGYFVNSNNDPQALIEHWNGSSWSVVNNPSVASTNYWLNEVATVSASDAWAAGYYDDASNVTHTLIEHWNGSSWTIISSVDPGTTHNELHSLTAVPGTSQLWAVGMYSNADDIWQALIEHWDGSAWTVIAGPEIGSSHNQLIGVVAASETEVWAVGHYWNPSGSVWNTLIEHWDGFGWSTASSPAVASSLTSLGAVTSVPGVGQFWAVGQYSSGANVLQTLALQCHP
jgi:hypothetical protein